MVVHNGVEAFHEAILQDIMHDRILIVLSFIMFSVNMSQFFIIFSLKSLLLTIFASVEMIIISFVSIDILRASLDNLRKHEEELALEIITEIHES